MDPVCLMIWASWIPILRWPQGASELQSWWRIWLLLWSPLLGESRIAWVVAANAIPRIEASPRTLERLDKMQGIQRSRMSVQQREEALFQQLGLSGLEVWSSQNQTATHTLPAEYHDIFSLDLGSWAVPILAKHEIKVTDYEPFKERFWRILQLMINKVCAHMKEMLEMGAIYPSHCLWCNAVMLVCKKDGSLCFCIDFHKLNVRTKRDLLPPMNTGSNSESSGQRVIFLLGLKSRILVDHHGWGFKHYTTFTMGNIGFLNVNACCLGCVKPQLHPKIDAEMSRWVEPVLLLDLFGWCNHLFKNGRRTHTWPVCSVWALQRA